MPACFRTWMESWPPTRGFASSWRAVRTVAGPGRVRGVARRGQAARVRLQHWTSGSPLESCARATFDAFRLPPAELQAKIFGRVRADGPADSSRTSRVPCRLPVARVRDGGRDRWPKEVQQRRDRDQGAKRDRMIREAGYKVVHSRGPSRSAARARCGAGLSRRSGRRPHTDRPACTLPASPAPALARCRTGPASPATGVRFVGKWSHNWDKRGNSPVRQQSERVMLVRFAAEVVSSAEAGAVRWSTRR